MADVVEVVLVTKKWDSVEGLIWSVFILVVTALLGGFALMFLVPLFTTTFTLPFLHPGYWTCVLLVGLGRFVVSSLFGEARPEASFK